MGFMRSAIEAHRAALATLACCLLPLMACTRAQDDSGAEWRYYGGSDSGDRYSPLTQINRGNVAQLEIAWRYDTGPGGLQTTPLMIDGILYGCTPTQTVFALDAATGRKVWQFTHQGGQTMARSRITDFIQQQPIRGLTYWSSGGQRRLFASTVSYLYALDPSTGRPIASFGDAGRIDLRENLGRPSETLPVFITSPGVIYRDLIIVGFRTSESSPAPPGDIRAYDVRTGRLRWSFHTIPHAGEPGAETWPAEAWRTAGGANNWAGMVVDERRGIVFAQTGSATPDMYGGDRLGDNLYANALVALDANTGRLRWHFQGVHHDIWDRDFPSPPVLLTVRHNGRAIDAVAQASKQGYLFVFDRSSGEPLFPIEERPVPASTVPGERTAPTQPFPVRPAPFARNTLTEDMLTTRTPAAHAHALQQFRTMQSGPPFTPWALEQDTIIFPDFDGGAEWGGQAVDRTSGVIYINANDVPGYSRLIPASPPGSVSRGEALYAEHCAACHRPDRAGAPPDTPSLRGVSSRYLGGLLGYAIRSGSGRMPAFPQLSTSDVDSLVQYLTDADSGNPRAPNPSAPAQQADAPSYTFGGYNRFVDDEGYPAVAPPWGTLNAIDLNTGDYVWRVPLGEYPDLGGAYGNTGSRNYGGPIVTAGGVVIIAATIYDRKIRAFNSATGALLWQGDLPFAGVATPITFMLSGRQYVVIATSGLRNRTGPQGSAYVAFALPQ